MGLEKENSSTRAKGVGLFSVLDKSVVKDHYILFKPDKNDYAIYC
jgi:hypothetical protein